MVIAEIVDVEAVVATYLREQGVRARVTQPDEDLRTDAWVKLALINAPSDPDLPVDYFIGYLVQLDCYAGKDGGPREARELGYHVRALLGDLPGEPMDGAVITAVQFPGFAAIPDTDMEPARERMIVTARVYAHPVANGGS